MNDQILDLTKDSGILDLTKDAPALKKLKVVVSWKEHPLYAKSLEQGFDLDLFSYVLNGSEKISGAKDVCYHKNKTLYNGAVVLPEDNRTGGSEETLFDLDKIPADKSYIDVFVFICDAVKRQQSLKMIQEATVSLVDQDTSEVIQTYRLSNYDGSVFQVGRLARNDSGFTFEPIGQVGNVDANVIAAAYM